MLVFGFLLFIPSFPTAGDNSILPSPNTGLFPYALARDACAGSPSLPVSSDLRGSFSLSLMLEVPKNDLAVDDVVTLYNGWVALRVLAVTSESLTPAVGGAGVVARGFALVVGASEGWAGGVARCSSSRRVYVPAARRQKRTYSSRVLSITFANH